MKEIAGERVNSKEADGDEWCLMGHRKEKQRRGETYCQCLE